MIVKFSIETLLNGKLENIVSWFARKHIKIENGILVNLGKQDVGKKFSNCICLEYKSKLS